MTSSSDVTLIDRIRDEFYPAWDGGDPTKFEDVSRSLFAANFETRRPGEPVLSLETVIPIWLEELAMWQPQRHEILTVIVQGNATAWEYFWEATHAPTGKHFEHTACVMARWHDGKINWWHAFGGSMEYMRQFVEQAEREAAAR